MGVPCRARWARISPKYRAAIPSKANDGNIENNVSSRLNFHQGEHFYMFNGSGIASVGSL